MGMIREIKESDLEEVFNLIYSAFGNQSFAMALVLADASARPS